MGSFINGRQAIISLGVTLGVILAVVIAAFVFRGEPPATVLRSSLAKTQTPATSGSAETGVSAAAVSALLVDGASLPFSGEF
jgi:hypothetical protein